MNQYAFLACNIPCAPTPCKERWSFLLASRYSTRGSSSLSGRNASARHDWPTRRTDDTTCTRVSWSDSFSMLLSRRAADHTLVRWEARTREENQHAWSSSHARAQNYVRFVRCGSDIFLIMLIILFFFTLTSCLMNSYITAITSIAKITLPLAFYSEAEKNFYFICVHVYRRT